MRHFNAGILSLVLWQVTACGEQVVGWDAGDRDAPSVLWTSPSPDATDVATNAAIIVAFDEEMDAETLTVTSFTLEGEARVDGSVTDEDGLTAFFTPDAELMPDTEYTGTVTVEATDLAGNALEEVYTWTFTTTADSDGPIVDTVAPRVIATSPEDEDMNVQLGAEVLAVFSEDMDPLSITDSTFEVYGPDDQPVDGEVSYDEVDMIATFVPDDPLLPDSDYEAFIRTGAKDLSLLGLDEDYSWTFSTEIGVFALEPIVLRSLSSFVAVAGAGLTNSQSSGTTTLNGDVGLSPLATCMSDGSPCSPNNPVINGTLYANDPAGVAAQAKRDLVLAYTDAWSRPPGTTYVGSDASPNQVLPPGVYTSGSSVVIGVDKKLTLDAQGDPNAVWIFQISSSLTVGNNVEILLINGAQAKHVFWVAVASSTIGTDVEFVGTVIAGESNSVGTDSTVVGRLVCRDGAISLLSNTITLPPL